MVRRERNQSPAAANSPTLEEQGDLLRGYRDGFQAVHVIATGLQTGLFQQLAAHPQGISCEELARLTGYHAPYLRVWCSTAYRYHILEADERGRYRLSPHMDSLLADRSHPDSMISTLLSSVTEQGPRMARYNEYLKSGEVGSHAEAYGRQPDRLDPPKNQEALQRRMWLEKTITQVPQLGEILSKGGRLLDIGCGPGVLLLQLAELYPAASFVGIDLVEVGGLNTARRLISERGFGGRITVQKVQAEDMTFREEFDAITMTSVFHEILPVELRERVFGACYQALKRPGWFIIRDSAYPSTLAEFREPRYRAGIFSQYQEMAWGTVHPTWEERQQWLANVGFSRVEHHFVSGPPQGMHYLDIAHKT